jgi:hypothetical protein
MDGLLVTQLGGVNLRTEIDEKKLWKDDTHLRLGTLYQYFAQFPYLKRISQLLHVSDYVWAA